MPSVSFPSPLPPSFTSMFPFATVPFSPLVVSLCRPACPPSVVPSFRGDLPLCPRVLLRVEVSSSLLRVSFRCALACERKALSPPTLKMGLRFPPLPIAYSVFSRNSPPTACPASWSPLFNIVKLSAPSSFSTFPHLHENFLFD